MAIRSPERFSSIGLTSIVEMTVHGFLYKKSMYGFPLFERKVKAAPAHIFAGRSK
jgi:hypothetical protein